MQDHTISLEALLTYGVPVQLLLDCHLLGHRYNQGDQVRLVRKACAIAITQCLLLQDAIDSLFLHVELSL